MNSFRPSIFGHSLQDYYVERFRQRRELRQKRLEAIRTAQEAREYVKSVRQAIRQAFPLPQRPQPAPEYQVVSEVKYQGFKEQSIIYWSRPSWPVSAALLMPENGCELHPGVLFLCGHDDAGKNGDVYRGCVRQLAAKGYAVLVPDPVSQGERKQYRYPNGQVFGCCDEHNRMGKCLSLGGDGLYLWRVNDALAGLDLLASLPQVDEKRLGVTGNSGGGTMTSFVNALDERPSMFAPGCYVTSFLHNVENELPVDAEQLPWKLGESSVEMADIIIAAAPRPVIILGQRNDFFDPRGAVESLAEIQRIYALLGAEENCRLVQGGGGHGFSLELRTAMYDFFNHHAGMASDAAEENWIAALPPMAPAAPPEGVTAIPGARSIQEFLEQMVTDCANSRKVWQEKHPEEVPEIVRQCLGIRLDNNESAPYYRVLRPQGGYSHGPFSRFGIESEPGRVMCVLKRYGRREWFHLAQPWRDEQGALVNQPVLYVADHDSTAEMTSRFSGSDVSLIYGLDVRGIGECMPAGADQGDMDFYGVYGFDYHYAALGYFLGETILGGRVKDILAALRLLQDSTGEKVVLRASGKGIIPAALATYLSAPNMVSELQCEGAIPSWEEAAKDILHLMPQSLMCHGALPFFDVRELLQLDRVDPQTGLFCYRKK